MRRLATIAFALVVLLTAVSAFIRLSQAGLGCSPWPACYAMLGDVPQTFPTASLLHRLSATTLGVLVLLINISAWRRGKQRTLAAAILVITLLLAALGVRSGGLLLPAVVLGNFSGGLLLTVMLGVLLLSRNDFGALPRPTPALALATLIGIAAIATGIASSAFYGNAGCSAWCECGVSQPLQQLAPFAPLGLDVTGHVLTTSAATTLQWLHRLAGLAGLIAFVGWVFAARRTAHLRLALSGLCVVLVTTVVGLLGGIQGVPISLAVFHSLSGAFILLILFRGWQRG